MGSDVPSGVSDLIDHVFLVGSGRSRCLSEDSSSSACAMAKASQDEYSVGRHLDHLRGLEWSMGGSDLRPSVWFFIRSGHDRFHLRKPSELFHHLLVFIGHFSLLVVTTHEIHEEDRLATNHRKSSSRNTTDHAYQDVHRNKYCLTLSVKLVLTTREIAARGNTRFILWTRRWHREEDSLVNYSRRSGILTAMRHFLLSTGSTMLISKNYLISSYRHETIQMLFSYLTNRTNLCFIRRRFY